MIPGRIICYERNHSGENELLNIKDDSGENNLLWKESFRGDGVIEHRESRSYETYCMRLPDRGTGR
jgi:hypothetical protein